MNGKITVEAGKYKSIFTITEDFEKTEVKVNIEPPIEKEDETEEANLVRFITAYLVKGLKG